MRQARLERQATQVAQAIREGNFLVSIDRMIPHTGAVRQVSQYSVQIKDNVLRLTTQRACVENEEHGRE